MNDMDRELSRALFRLLEPIIHRGPETAPFAMNGNALSFFPWVTLLSESWHREPRVELSRQSS